MIDKFLSLAAFVTALCVLLWPSLPARLYEQVGGTEGERREHRRRRLDRDLARLSALSGEIRTPGGILIEWLLRAFTLVVVGVAFVVTTLTLPPAKGQIIQAFVSLGIGVPYGMAFGIAARGLLDTQAATHLPEQRRQLEDEIAKLSDGKESKKNTP